MPAWKQRDPRNKFKGFLEHLDSNYCNQKRRGINHLKKTFYPYAENLIKHFKNEGFIEEKNKIISLTIKGFKELDYWRDQKLKNESLNIEREKIMVEILSVSSIFLALIGGFQNNPIIKWATWGVGFLIFAAIIVLFRRYSKFRKFFK